MNATISALIEKHLNATLTTAEAAALAQAMAENQALAEEFAAATRMEADLSAAIKEKERTALYTRRMERAAAETAPARMRRPWPVKTMTAAAGLAALIGVGWRLMEVEPDNKTTAKKGSSASSRAVAGHSQVSSDLRSADASAMKRKLRRFASSTSRLRSVPVSQALAALQAEWQDYAHSNAKDKDAVFTVAAAVSKEWQKPEDEPAVSLEIPGISLLTSLELIAAQAGLKTTVTATGVSLEPFPRKDDGKQRTWSIPLSLASVSTFMTRVSDEQHIDNAVRRSGGTWFFKLADNSRNMSMSWMVMPVARLAGSDTEEVKRLFNRGLGYFDLGQFNEAETEFNRILAIDPQNVAARRQLERTRREVSHYLTSGRDETRLRMLNAVDNLWVTTIPGTDVGVGPITGSDVLQTDTTSQTGPVVVWDAPALHNDYLVDAAAGETTPDFTYQLPTEYLSSPDTGGYTIDLNLAPEFVEFDGFINYGEPIQTTGINALGQSEPVILTESGITQPVFANLRMHMDYPANLTRLLAAHGVPAEGATWDQENGVVTARGPLSKVRAAQAAAAAVEEAASSGVTVEMKVIEWKNGVPAPVADRSGVLPPPATGQSGTISGAVVSDLLGDPDLDRVGDGKATQHAGVPFTLTEAQSYDASGVIADVGGITASGFSWHVPGKIRREDGTVTGIARSREERELDVQQFDLQLEDREWLRVDFPAHPGAKAVTVLLSVQPATVQP